MADVFTNDLRIREQAVGANSNLWGGYLNTSLENIAEAFSYGTEALADSATQTLTLADGASDELRSFYVKLTGTLSQATTVTLAPNTISKVWMIENATSGGYDVTISQGSGANVTVGNGNVKMIATDGAGSGGVVYDLLTDLELAGGLTVTKASSGATPTAGTVVTIEDDDNTELSLLGGSSSVLAINFGHSGDADDGIITYNTTSGSEAMGFTVNALNRVTINKDGYVGISTTSPATLLDVKGSTGNSVITLNSAAAIDSYPSIGKLRFFSNDNSTNSSGEVGSIEVIGIGTWNGAANAAAMTFNLIQGLAGTTSPVEAMRIQNSGITQFFTGDGNSGIAEFHTNASSGNATSYISIRPQGTARGYIGNGTSLLSGADNSDFIVRGESYLLLNSGGNQQVATLTDTNDFSLNGNPRSTSYINGKLATNIVSNRRVAFYASGNMDATFRAQGANSTYVGIMAGATRLSNDASYLYFANNTEDNGGSWSAYIKHITGDTALKGKLKFLTNDGSLWHNALEITNTGTDKVLTNSGDVGTISDQRLKKNIEDLTYSLETFKDLKPRTFEWINPSEHEEGTINGFVAQELPDPYKYGYQVEETITIDKGEKVDNPDYELVKDTNGEAFAGTLGQSDAMYVSVIQQLITKIENLETEVNALKGG